MNLFFSNPTPENQTCSTVSLSSFTKQLATLLGSGIQLHEALELLSRDESDEMAVWVVPEVTKKVLNGARLSHSLAMFPRVFSLTYLALVRAAEETGKLVSVLEGLGAWLDRRDSTARHVKKALTYPLIVLVLAVVLTLGLFHTVIPGILDTVVGLGVELPAATRVLAGMVAVVQHPVSWLAAALLAVGLTVYLRSPRGRVLGLWLLTRTPVLGQLLRHAAASRFAQTLGMLLETGVEITRAVRISLDATGHPVFIEDAPRLVAALKQGRLLSESIGQNPLYPRLIADLAKVGDESGRMAPLLKRAGEILDEETLHKVESFLNLLEPLVLAAISIFVGFVVVAILLPLSSLTASLA